MTKLEDIDRLINWYEKNAPQRGQKISTGLGPRTLARLLRKAPAPEQTYRERILVANGRDKERNGQPDTSTQHEAKADK